MRTIVSTLIAWAAIIGFLPAVLNLAMQGRISLKEAALICVLEVFLLVISRKLAGLATPCLAAWVFLRGFAGPDNLAMKGLLGEFIALSVALMGFWVMFLPFRRKHGKRQ